MKKYFSILILGGLLTVIGCRSSNMPCPTFSQKDKKEKAFQMGGSDVKYDRNGRVKK